MSVSSNQIVLYCSAQMVSGDGQTVGGAVNFSQRPAFSDLASAQVVAWVSSATGDTAVTGTVWGRDSTGALQIQATTLNGQTPVSGAQTYARLLQGQFSGSAVGDIAVLSSAPVVTGTAQAATQTSGITAPSLTLAAGQGASAAIEQVLLITNNTPAGVQGQLRRVIAVSGDVVSVSEDWGTLPSSSTTYALYTGMLMERSPNSVTGIIRMFDAAVAPPSVSGAISVYSKIFLVNNSTTTSLTNASASLESFTAALPGGDSAGIGLAGSLNDTGTSTNRQTAPAGITFVTGALPLTLGIPSPGNLPAGAAPNAAGAQAVWLELVLGPGSQPYNGFATIQANGSST